MNKPFPAGTICTSPPARYGLTTTIELISGGLSHSAISRRVARGALVRRYPGVYSFGPGELSSEAQAMAAVLAAGAGAVLNHLSAAALWKTSRFQAPIPHVLVPRRHRPIEGIVIHHCLRLDPLEVIVYRGIPVTTVARMLVDLSDVLTKWQLANVIHEAAFRGRFSVAATRRAMQRANGRRNLRVLEQAVEVDGPGHERPAAKGDDARKDSKLQAAGFTVVRFTDIEIEQRPADVIGRLRSSF